MDIENQAHKSELIPWFLSLSKTTASGCNRINETSDLQVSKHAIHSASALVSTREYPRGDFAPGFRPISGKFARFSSACPLVVSGTVRRGTAEQGNRKEKRFWTGAQELSEQIS